VFHRDLSGVLDLAIVAAERRYEPRGRHGASDADFALASDLRTADGCVLLVKNADRRGSEKEAKDATSVDSGTNRR